MKELNVDKMTGFRTSVAFDDVIAEATMATGEKAQSTISVAIFDIDRYLALNQKYGHDEGDAILIELAGLFKTMFCDEGLETFRIGGDEFAVLLGGVEKEQAFLRLEAARSAYENLESLNRFDPHPTISIGVATYPDDGSTRQELMRKADDALFRAKTSGRNRVALAREEKKVPKTSHYTQGQLERLNVLSKEEGVGEAELLREALDDLLKKYSS